MIGMISIPFLSMVAGWNARDIKTTSYLRQVVITALCLSGGTVDSL